MTSNGKYRLIIYINCGNELQYRLGKDTKICNGDFTHLEFESQHLVKLRNLAINLYEDFCNSIEIVDINNNNKSSKTYISHIKSFSLMFRSLIFTDNTVSIYMNLGSNIRIEFSINYIHNVDIDLYSTVGDVGCFERLHTNNTYNAGLSFYELYDYKGLIERWRNYN